MPRRTNAKGLTANQQINLMDKAMSGDLVMTISPATVTPEPTAAAWTRTVNISVKTAAGELHTWLNDSYATSLAITDDSSAGTAAIASTTLTLVNGQAAVIVSGDAETWADTETDTLTVSDLTVLGYTVSGGTSVETFTAV